MIRALKWEIQHGGLQCGDAYFLRLYVQSTSFNSGQSSSLDTAPPDELFT